MGAEVESLTPKKYLKEVQIGPHAHHVTNIGTPLSIEDESELVDQLIKNAYLFAWAPSDMSGIDTNLVTYCFAIHPSTRLVVQREQKDSK